MSEVRVGVSSGKKIMHAAHTAWITCCGYVPAQRWIVTGSLDCSIKVWTIDELKMHSVINVHAAPVTRMIVVVGR
jgi:WD40 repeat protein